jgi:hypothetical protein
MVPISLTYTTHLALFDGAAPAVQRFSIRWARCGTAGGGGRDPFINEGGYQHKVGASIEDIAAAPPSERCALRMFALHVRLSVRRGTASSAWRRFLRRLMRVAPVVRRSEPSPP